MLNLFLKILQTTIYSRVFLWKNTQNRNDNYNKTLQAFASKEVVELGVHILPATLIKILHIMDRPFCFKSYENKVRKDEERPKMIRWLRLWRSK